MKNKEIDFLLFTVKQTEEIIVDVTVDLFMREYTIAYTNLYGHIVEPEKGGKLRRKAVNEFLNKLADLDIVSLQRNEKNTLPLHLKNATLMYLIKDEEYFTDGDSDADLSKLHKEIEYLIGDTFGSYEFYGSHTEEEVE